MSTGSIHGPAGIGKTIEKYVSSDTRTGIVPADSSCIPSLSRMEFSRYDTLLYYSWRVFGEWELVEARLQDNMIGGGGGGGCVMMLPRYMEE